MPRELPTKVRLRRRKYVRDWDAGGWEIFENSRHMPFVEQPECSFQVVGSFLADDARAIERRVFIEWTNGPLLATITNLREVAGI